MWFLQIVFFPLIIIYSGAFIFSIALNHRLTDCFCLIPGCELQEGREGFVFSRLIYLRESVHIWGEGQRERES